MGKMMHMPSKSNHRRYCRSKMFRGSDDLQTGAGSDVIAASYGLSRAQATHSSHRRVLTRLTVSLDRFTTTKLAEGRTQPYRKMEDGTLDPWLNQHETVDVETRAIVGSLVTAVCQ